MSKQWFVRRANKEHGPFTAEQLKTLASSGRLADTDLVRRDDMADWRRADSVKGLFPNALPPESTSIARPDEGPKGNEVKPAHTPPLAGRAGTALKAMWSYFLGTAKAAKQLATAQASVAKINGVDLPSAYLALGKSIFEAGTDRLAYPDLFQKIEDKTAQIKGLSKHDDPPAATFKETITAKASQATNLAKQKLAIMDLDSCFRELGKTACDSAGASSAPHKEVSRVAELLEQRSAGEVQIAEIRKSGGNGILTPQRLLVGSGLTLLLICVGLLWSASSAKISGTSTSAASSLKGPSTGTATPQFSLTEQEKRDGWYLPERLVAAPITKMQYNQVRKNMTKYRVEDIFGGRPHKAWQKLQREWGGWSTEEIWLYAGEKQGSVATLLFHSAPGDVSGKLIDKREQGF